MTTEQKQEMSVRALISFRECEKSLPFSNLPLHFKGDKKLAFWRHAKEFIADCMQKQMRHGDLKEHLKGFFVDYYEESFFDFRVQYEAGIKKDYKKLERFVDYLYRQGYQVVAGKTSFRVPIDTACKGISLSGVHGEADMIIRTQNGRYLAVMIMPGEPKYSYTAKRESNHAEYAIELPCLYLGLCDRYGKDMETALFYLKNKDDKRDYLVPEYENRKGKNIIKGMFRGKEEAMDRLYSAVSLSVTPDCAACHFGDVCKLARYYPCTAPEPAQRDKQVTLKEAPLTKAQTEVVNHKNGPMCVIAVPGAGKTHSLVQRMVRLIQVDKVKPSEILFLTFTQKAAGEIKERVSKHIGAGSAAPGVYTFHALAYSILREHPEAFRGVFRLATKVDRFRLIEDALQQVPRIEGVSYDGLTGRYGLLETLNQAFCFIENFGSDRYQAEYHNKRDVNGIMKAYTVFLKLYQQEGFISYDDQIQLVVQIFKEKPRILKNYQKRYRYVMVDEFQDISQEQVEMVYQISAHGNLVVVGDDDQTIFSWRGGSSKYMLDFKNYWKGARQVTLEDNYRSVDTVLYAADHVIRRNANRFVKKLQAHSFTDIKPVYISNMMAGGMINIVRSILSKGYQPGDIAVIARKNKELSTIEENLLPYVDVLPSRQYLIQDAVFLLIHDVLHLFYHGMDDRCLYRFLKHTGAAAEIPDILPKHTSLYESLCKKGILLPINWRDIECMPSYKSRYHESRLMGSGFLLLQIFKELQYGHGIETVLPTIFQMLFHAKGHLAVDALTDISKERLLSNMRDLMLHMDDMLRYYDETEIEYPIRPDAVNLLTGHKAKGKEYPAVIIFNVDSFEDTPEDRCLLYVAMTRAERLLYITQAPYTKAELLNDMIGLVNICQAG